MLGEAEASGGKVGELAMPKKATSPRAARAASNVLRDGRTSKKSKPAAGSALSQREKVRKKNK